MRFDQFITTGCCDASSNMKAVNIGFPFIKENWGKDIPYKDQKPEWLIDAMTNNDDFASEARVIALFCPFCGTKVPNIILNPDADKHLIHESTDGDYCDTCNKRNGECNCTPPEFRWKPEGVDVIFPKVYKDEDDDDAEDDDDGSD